MNDEPTIPEMDSYEITTTRKFEVDLSEAQVQKMVQTTGLADPGEAVEQVFLQRETQHVQPEQKLLGVDVQADGPSDE